VIDWRGADNEQEIETAMNSTYPLSTAGIVRLRRDLVPNQQAGFEAFGKAVFAGGVLSAKANQVIAVAVAHVSRRPYRSVAPTLT
jgi:hypothetical protein